MSAWLERDLELLSVGWRMQGLVHPVDLVLLRHF